MLMICELFLYLKIILAGGQIHGRDRFYHTNMALVYGKSAGLHSKITAPPYCTSHRPPVYLAPIDRLGPLLSLFAICKQNHFSRTFLARGVTDGQPSKAKIGQITRRLPPKRKRRREEEGERRRRKRRRDRSNVTRR